MSLTALTQQIRRSEISEIQEGDGEGRATTRSGQVVSFSTQRGQSILKVLANLGATPDELSRITYTVAEPPPSWLTETVNIS